MNCELMDIQVDTISNITLNHLVNHIDFVRMDIEGFEFEAISGLRDYLDSGQKRPTILFEAHPTAYHDERDMGGLLQMLVELYGYQIKTVVSTNGGRKFFDEAGISPDREIYSDGVYRYIYIDLPNRLATEGILTKPKIVRYAMLKHVGQDLCV